MALTLGTASNDDRDSTIAVDGDGGFFMRAYARAFDVARHADAPVYPAFPQRRLLRSHPEIIHGLQRAIETLSRVATVIDDWVSFEIGETDRIRKRF
jgi:hypothetical protein